MNKEHEPWDTEEQAKQQRRELENVWNTQRAARSQQPMGRRATLLLYALWALVAAGCLAGILYTRGI